MENQKNPKISVEQMESLLDDDTPTQGGSSKEAVEHLSQEAELQAEVEDAPQTQLANDNSSEPDASDADEQAEPKEVEAQPEDATESEKTGHNSEESVSQLKPKRSFKTDTEREEALEKVVAMMRDKPENSKIRLTDIKQTCNCSAGPAESLYTTALGIVGKLILLDKKGANTTRIPEPKVTSKGLSVTLAYIDYLFAGNQEENPYKEGSSITCVRDGENLIISPKNEGE